MPAGLFVRHTNTYLFGMIGLIGGLSLAMSGTNSTLVRDVNPPKLQNVTWSAVTCSKEFNVTQDSAKLKRNT